MSVYPFYRKQKYLKYAALLPLVLSTLVNAGEVNLQVGVEAEYTVQTVDDKTQGTEIDSDNIIIRPFVSVSYDARDLDLLATATHNHVRRSLESEDVTNNYTDFNYLGRYQIVRNLLTLQVNGSQSYRSQAANSFLVDNFLLNAENLRKNRVNAASLNFNLPTGNYIGINAQVGANKINSENQTNEQVTDIDFRNINTTSYNGNIQVESGRDLRPFLYDVNGSIRVSDRENQQDFESQVLNLRVGSNISSNFSLRVLGYYENNEISNDAVSTNTEVSRLREFYSYGMGIAWQPSSNRFIELGLNRSTTKGQLGEEDEEDDYVSIDMQWNFSSRTSVSANYARRFFGSSGSFRFAHNLRNWRSNISYSENVTTNSQLLLNQENGLLVCSNGSTDLADCSLSDGLDPSELGPGEVLVPFVTTDFELNDRVVLRKALTAQTSVDLRRTTLTASITQSNNEEVEVARDVETLTGRIGASLNVSARSTITASLLYSDIQRTLDVDVQVSKVKQASIEFERRLTRRFFASIGYSYLDRSGDVVGNAGGIQGINGPLTDNRITAEIRYEFDSNR